MRVGRIQNSTNFQGKLNQRTFKAELKDGAEAVVRLTVDKNRKLNAIEYFSFKNGEFVGGAGIGKNGGINSYNVGKFLGNLQANAKEGFNFYEEFEKIFLAR